MALKNAVRQQFDLEGHRGCRGLMPENTIPAMLRAIDLEVNTLEMDVVITADKKVVVSHEPYFNPEFTTFPGGDTMHATKEWDNNLYHMTYDSVKLFDVGMKPHPRFPEQQKMKAVKPLLADLVHAAEAYCLQTLRPKIHYNIEIKSHEATDEIFHPEPAAFADLVMQVVLEKKIEDRTIIQSFDVRILRVMKSRYPFMKLACLVEKGQSIPLSDFEKWPGFRPEVLSPEFSMLTKDIVYALHNENIKVVPWTVNDLEAAKHLYLMGIDGIITDYPDRISADTIRE